MKYFGSLLPSDYLTFIGTSYDWIRKQANSQPIKINQIDTLCGPEQPDNVIQACSNGVNAGFLIVHGNVSEASIYGSSVAAHELFHVIQAVLMFKGTGIDPAGKYWMPNWLIEGSADWVGTEFYDLFAGLNYLQVKDNYFQDISIDHPLRDYDVEATNGEYYYPYYMGRLATEILVANIGFQNLLNIFVNFNSNGDFKKSFQKASGISLDDFYNYFEKVRTKIGLPPASQFYKSNTQQQGSPSQTNSSDSATNSGDLNNQPCSSENQITKNSVGEYWCIKDKSGVLRWALNHTDTGSGNSSSNGTQASKSTDNALQNSQDNLLEKPCQKLGEEKTTFYLWVCTNVKDKGLIWIRKGTESQYEIIKS